MDKLNKYLITNENDLNVRSINIINEIGGLAALIEYYNINKTFKQLRKVGSSTNFELVAYCKYLTETEGSEFYISPFKNNKLQSPIPHLNENEADLIYNIYLNEKEFLRTRAKHVLDKLEQELLFTASTYNKINFFEKYFLSDFNYKMLPNIGTNSERQIIYLRNKLRDSVAKLKDVQGSHEIGERLLLNKLSALFKHKYSVEQLAIFVEGNKYNIKSVLCTLIYDSGKSLFNLSIIENYLFVNNDFNIKELSLKLGCSQQLIRNTIKTINIGLIKNLLNLIKSNIPYEPYDIICNPFSEYLVLHNFSEFIFNDRVFKPNNLLSKLFYQEYYKDRFALLDYIIESQKLVLNCFQTQGQNLLISNDFAQKCNFIEFLTFLNDEISNFTVIGFEYNLSVLISRFYNENNIKNITKEDLEILNQIVVRILRSDFEINPNTLRKVKSRETSNRVIDIAEELLLKINTPLKTQKILEEVHLSGIQLTTPELLRKLGKNSSIFVRLGNSLWGLKNNNRSVVRSGSLREIVEDILNNRKDPIHISELLLYFAKIRPISVHSLLTNLRSAENNKFRFFNCSFIGLGQKKYDNSWDRIPQLNPGHLKQVQFDLENKSELNEWVEYLYKNYGYPKIHTSYLLSNRKSKSEI